MPSRGAALLVLAVLTILVSQPAPAQSTRNDEFKRSRFADFEERLVLGLKARTEEEKKFLAKVVKTVEDGRLSEGFVTAVYQRARYEHSRYPLPYFSAMLRKLAKQKNVEL